MNARETLEAVAAGNLSVDQALLDLKKAPFEDLGYAKVDLHRGVRQGAAEVIYGAGKTAEQITGIASAMLKNHISTALITRMDAEKAAKVAETLPLDYHPDARIGILGPIPEPTGLTPAHEDGELVTLVDIDFDAYRRAHDMRTIRKNVTIPSYLNDLAERAGVNFSQVLQDALKTQMGI